MIRRVRVADVIDHNVERANLRQELREILSILPIREWVFIDRYFIQGETYREIGDDVNLSRTRVNQIINKGLRRLRREVEYGRL